MLAPSVPELILVLGVALVVFGPKKLPELGAGLGKAIREFQNATKEIVPGPEKEADRMGQIRQVEAPPSSSSVSASSAEKPLSNQKQG